MDYIKKHINGILGSILFHLVIIIIALSLQINHIQKENTESYLIITPEYFEEIDKENKEEEELKNKNQDDIDLEKYIADIHNLRLNNNQSQSKEQESMSQEELKQMYEEEFLKEKYGDNYEKFRNSSYEDYLDKTESSDTYQDKKDIQKKSNQVISEAGIVLVEYKLDNEDRKAIDLYVPSYKCEGGGKIVIKISIRQDGTVRSANVLSKDDDAKNNDCIINTAKSAALKSKFTSISGAAIENGTITYIFVNQ